MYTFTATIWKYTAETASWYFVSLPKQITDEIKTTHKTHQGWGQRKVSVTIGKTTWQTSIFPDKIRGFVLPIKKSVRVAEGLDEGDKTSLSLSLQ